MSKFIIQILRVKAKSSAAHSAKVIKNKLPRVFYSNVLYCMMFWLLIPFLTYLEIPACLQTNPLCVNSVSWVCQPTMYVDIEIILLLMCFCFSVKYCQNVVQDLKCFTALRFLFLWLIFTWLLCNIFFHSQSACLEQPVLMFKASMFCLKFSSCSLESEDSNRVLIKAKVCFSC